MSKGFSPVRVLRQGRWAVLLVAASLLAGCGGNGNRPRTAKVTGRVTYEGKAIPTGSLLFVPEGGGPSAQGNIAEDGTYTLGTFKETDGAVLGNFKVIITAWTRAEGGSGLPEDAGKGNAAPVSLIPEIYGDMEKSGLTATVKEEANQIDFNLEKKEPPKKKVSGRSSTRYGAGAG